MTMTDEVAVVDGPRLNLGCGTDYKVGWVNIDNNSDHNIARLDLNWDLTNPLPFADASVAYVYNEHLIEHLSVDQSRRAISDFLRVLRPDGILRIAMPDVRTAIDKYLHVALEDDETMQRFDMGFIQTRAERLNMAFRWWGHQWLYDWEELKRRLLEVGCPPSSIRQCSRGESRCPALRHLETRTESVLVAEATKWR